MSAPDPAPPATAAQQPGGKGAVASPELRPGQIGRGGGANGGFAGEMGRMGGMMRRGEARLDQDR